MHITAKYYIRYTTYMCIIIHKYARRNTAKAIINSNIKYNLNFRESKIKRFAVFFS